MEEAGAIQFPFYPIQGIGDRFQRLFRNVVLRGLSDPEGFVTTAYELLLPMLLGVFLWQIGILRRSWEHRRSFLFLFFIGGGIGLATASIAGDLNHQSSLFRYGMAEALTPRTQVVRSICLNFGWLGLNLGYIALAALLLSGRIASRFLAALAPAGRMAFTNYVLQWVLPPMLFPLLFGWWLRNPGPAQGILKVTLAFALMVLFSTWWLKRFRFGPFEWLWRSSTYWKLQPMRVRPASPTT
ncbi:MAG: DUF418 domain-containing protein [Gemmatimonadota bacterium]